MAFDYEAEQLIKQFDEARTSLVHLLTKTKILAEAFSALDEADFEFEPSEGAVGYVPLDVSDFIKSLLELETVLKNDPDYRHSDLPYRPCAFLEVGCGTGRNLFLLKHAERFRFAKIVGFDVASKYVEYGRRLYRLDKEMFVDDCLTFDYGGFDVVFFYRPFQDDDQQAAFEGRLIDSMKRGAYLVAHSDETLDDSRQLMRVDDSFDVWKKL